VEVREDFSEAWSWSFDIMEDIVVLTRSWREVREVSPGLVAPFLNSTSLNGLTGSFCIVVRLDQSWAPNSILDASLLESESGSESTWGGEEVSLGGLRK